MRRQRVIMKDGFSARLAQNLHMFGKPTALFREAIDESKKNPRRRQSYIS